VGQVKIVTDSTADLPAEVATALGITVVPLNVHFGREVLRDGVDITSDEFFRRLRSSQVPPVTSPPSAKTFEEVYARLSQTTDNILSLHISSKLSQTCANALRASRAYLGRINIHVLDSMSTSRGLGILASAAAEAARSGASLDDLVRMMRAFIPRVYVAFFVDTLDYLERGGRIGKAQALLGTMFNVKPLLAIEEGEIVPLEKLRNRARAIERLCEFVLEFSDIRQLIILHHDNAQEVAELVELIHTLRPTQQYEVTTYGPVLATHVGPRAMGVVVLEEANS